MFCGSCGQQLTAQDKFCPVCGDANTAAASGTAAEEIAVAGSAPLQKEFVPRPRMKSKTKRWLIFSSTLVVVIFAAYLIARSLHGIATPEALQQKFSTALKAHDTATLSSLLDADSKDLIAASSLGAFKTSLSDEVLTGYLQQLQREVDLANQAKEANKVSSSSSTSHGWLTLKHTSSWLGDDWKVHVASVGIKAEPIAQDSVQFSIGDLKSTDGELNHLWPSLYSYTATVSNPYASENLGGQVNFLDQVGSIPASGVYNYSLDLGNSVKSVLQITAMESVPDLQVFINDKPVTMNGDSVVISPAPIKPTLEVKGTVLGVKIDQKGTVNDQDQNPVENLLKQGVAQHAMDILYDAALSWTKAYNEGNPSDMLNADPNGDYYKMASAQMTSVPTTKTILTKVMVDPNSVQINKDSILIQDSEYYTVDNVPNTNNGSFSLQQVAGKTEWWIESQSSSYWSVSDPSGKFTKEQK